MEAGVPSLPRLYPKAGPVIVCTDLVCTPRCSSTRIAIRPQGYQQKSAYCIG
jgi:hypothetical protein